MTIKSRVEDLLASRRLGHAAASGPVFFFLSMVYAVEKCVDELFDPAVALLDKKEYTRVMCRCLRSFRASSNYVDTDTVPMGLNIKTLLSKSTSFVRTPTAQNFDFVHDIVSGRDIVREMMNCTAELEGFSADLTLWLDDGDRLRMPRYARDRISALRADVTMRDGDVERLQRDLEAKEDQLQQANSHIDKLTRQQSATGSSAVPNVTPAALSTNVVDKAEFDKLRDELEEYKGKINEYEAFSTRQEERLRNAIDNSEALEGELYNCGKSLKQANERIDQLNSQLSADTAKVTHDVSNSADSNEQAEFDSLCQELEVQREKLAEYEEFTHRQDERLANSIANAEALETELYASGRCLKQANAKIERLEAQLKDLSSKKTAAEIKKTGSTDIAASKQIASLAMTIVDKQQTIGSLSTELHSEHARFQLEQAIARYEGRDVSEIEALQARHEERQRAACEEERRLAKALTECLHDAQEATDSVALAETGHVGQSVSEQRGAIPRRRWRSADCFSTPRSRFGGGALGPAPLAPIAQKTLGGNASCETELSNQARPIQNVLASCPVDHRDTIDVEPEDGNDKDEGEDLMKDDSSAPTAQIISGSEDQAENRVGEAAADDFAAGQKGERESAAKPSRKRSYDLVLDTTQQDDDEQNKPKPKRPKSGLHEELEEKLCQDLDKLFDEED